MGGNLTIQDVGEGESNQDLWGKKTIWDFWEGETNQDRGVEKNTQFGIV